MYIYIYIYTYTYIYIYIYIVLGLRVNPLTLTRNSERNYTHAFLEIDFIVYTILVERKRLDCKLLTIYRMHRLYKSRIMKPARLQLLTIYRIHCLYQSSMEKPARLQATYY